MLKTQFNNIRRIRGKERNLRLVLLLFFLVGFNKDKKASYYSRTSNFKRGIVVIRAWL